MANLKLVWAPNPVSELVTTYEVFQAVGGGMSTSVAETTDNFYVLTDPAPGVYTFAVRAKNIAGNGPQSVSVNSPGVPTAPTGLVLTVV